PYLDADPVMSPEVTAATVEQLLTNIMGTLSQEKIRYVGIVATDVRDTLFLTNRVREFCPDVQLFTTRGSLLYAHPEFTSQTHGMLIASSYPMWWGNRQKRAPERTRSQLVFFDESELGVYNATIALLDGDRESSDSPRLKHLLEYWHPDRVNEASLDQTRPPVWISVVGRNGVWPIQVGEPSEGDRELYQRYVYGATQNFGPGTDEERDVSEREVSWLWV